MKNFVLSVVALISLLVVTGCGFMSQINNSADVKNEELVIDVPVILGDDCTIKIKSTQKMSDIVAVRSTSQNFSADLDNNNVISVNFIGKGKGVFDTNVQVCAKDFSTVYKSIPVQIDVQGWRKLKQSDVSVWKTESFSFTVDDEGNLTGNCNGGHRWLKLNEKIKEIKIESAQFGSILLFTDLVESGPQHNGVFIGTYSQNAGTHHTGTNVTWTLKPLSDFGDALKGWSAGTINNVHIKRNADGSVTVANNGGNAGNSNDVWMTFDTSKNNMAIANSIQCFGFFLGWSNVGNQTLSKVMVIESD